MVDEVFFSFDEIIISLSPSFFAQSCITTSTIYIYDATANIYVFNANPAYSRVEVHERPSNSFTANKQANITGYGSVSGHNVFSYLFFFRGEVNLTANQGTPRGVLRDHNAIHRLLLFLFEDLYGHSITWGEEEQNCRFFFCFLLSVIINPSIHTSYIEKPLKKSI